MKKTLTAMGVVGLVLHANDALARELDNRDNDGASFTGRPGENFEGGSEAIRGAGSYDQYIFTTSASGAGAFEEWAAATGSGLVGMDAADLVCQSAASGAGLPNAGTYVAWISDSQNDAYCRAHGLYGTKDDDCGASGGLPTTAGPWLRTDGQLFGGDLPGIVDDGEVYRPVELDANGSPVFFPQRVWTGTSPDGTSDGFNCTDWTTASSGDGSGLFLGMTGDTQGTVVNWTADAIQSCSEAGRLTCLSTGTSGIGTPPPPPYTDSERRAFVSSLAGPASFSTWQLPGGGTPDDQGLQGLDAADAICRSLAGDADLDRPDEFKALLSDVSTSIFQRFDFQNQWYRVDHVKIVENLGDLFEPEEAIQTAIALNEQGLPVVEITDVWTGVDTQGTSVADCNGWTSSSSGEGTSIGSAVYSDLRLIFNGSQQCSEPAHLYCFSDSDQISSHNFSREDFYK